MESATPQVWGARETAKFLGRTEGAVRNLVLRRQIPYRKLAGRLVFLRCEIEAWINAAPGVRLEEVDHD
jgi:hypothetical protein